MELDKTRKRKQSSSNEQALDDTKVPKLIDTASSSNSNEFIENEKNISSHVEIENMDTEITTREKQTSVGNQDGNNKRNQEVFVEEQQQLYEEAVNGCSSNMRKILENWKKHISNEELEDRVLDLYTELKLNNIPLVEEVEMFIYEFLLKRCFLQQTSTTSFKIGDIKEHVKFVSNIVDIISSFADDEEISIFSLQYLTKEIYLLKHLLRSTYDKLPWEEIELYLLCFIISETQQHDLKACYKAILKKSELIKFLKNFSSILKKIQIEEVGELLKLPDLKRSAVVDKIIENCPDFKTLYNKFDHIRDIYSLYKISEYAKLIHSKQPQEKGAKKIIIRVICMISQHLKNTLIAPKLSAFTANFILLSVSDKLRRTILNFIDSTSYRETFKYKLKLDKNFYKTLQTIRNDVDQIGEIADELLLRHYIRLFTQKYEETAFKSIVEEIDNTFSIALCVDKQFKRLHITDTPCFVENLIDNLNEVKSFLPEDNPIRVQLENIIKTKLIPKNYWQGKPAYARIMKGGRVDERKLFLQYVSLNLNIDEVQDILRIVEFMKNHNRKKESNKNKIEKLCAETMNLLMFDANIDIRNVFDTNTLQEYFIVRDKVETYSTNYHDYLSQSRQELGNILQKSSYKKLKTENKTLELMKSLILDIIMVNEILNSGNGHENDPNLHSMWIDYLESDYELNALFFDSVMATFLIAQTFTQEDPKHIMSTRSNETKYSREKNTFLDNFVTIAKKQRIFSKVAKHDLDIFTEENADIRARDFENSTYLHIAVKMCNNQQISNLCNQGLSFNCKNINLFTPLHIAAKNGNDEVVLHIVKKTKNLIDQVDGFGRTALHMAVLNGHNDTVKILIESGSNPFLKDHLGFTALIYAVICKNEVTLKLFQLQKEKLARHILESNDMLRLCIEAIRMNLLEIVEILLNENLLKLDAKNKATAMYLAVYYGHLEILQVLLRYDINTDIYISGTPLLHLAVQKGQKHVIPTLRNAGADPFEKDKHGKSSFSYALSDGKKEILSSLLSDNRNECSKEIDLENLFNIAIKQNDIDLVKGLLSQKLVKLDVKSKTFAICSAVSNGQIEILETLLRHGADPNNYIEGRAPILIAAQTNFNLIVEKLVEWKCDVNIRNPKDGKTALHYAASNGYESIIHCLLNHPAININPTDLEAQTPLHIAVEHSHLNTVEILLSRKDINVNALNSKMYTPLHIAAEKGDINIVKLLIEKWAIVDSADFSVSPLQLATENGHDEIVELLSLFQKLHTKLQRTKSSIG